MASVPTPIPESTAQLVKSYWRRLWRGGWLNTLWKAFVVSVTLLVGYVAIAGGPGFFVSFAAGTLLAYYYTDDLVAAYQDVLNRRFWIWRP